MSDYKSERTKKIEKSKVDDDMPAVKKAVRGAFLGLSRASDKVEGLFKKKDDKKEEEKKMQKGGMPKKAFKPCPGCPSPAKCKAAGKCMMMEKKGTKKAAAGAKATSKGAAGMLVIPVKMSKAPAKKKAKK